MGTAPHRTMTKHYPADCWHLPGYERWCCYNLIGLVEWPGPPGAEAMVSGPLPPVRDPLSATARPNKLSHVFTTFYWRPCNTSLPRNALGLNQRKHNVGDLKTLWSSQLALRVIAGVMLLLPQRLIISSVQLVISGRWCLTHGHFCAMLPISSTST